MSARETFLGEIQILIAAATRNTQRTWPLRIKDVLRITRIAFPNMDTSIEQCDQIKEIVGYPEHLSSGSLPLLV
ncbi:5357_t:CDS:2 [Acaulospora morrowiae]|uniref:5357_t:CDS:1 n=1 Tax=Acaulospora morrowiae TaxID=94023 RepID=A0A9N8VF00_9GLOM|nr:5357_t:CDS:2 [Acaulospora morrowiae]